LRQRYLYSTIGRTGLQKRLIVECAKRRLFPGAGEPDGDIVGAAVARIVDQVNDGLFAAGLRLVIAIERPGVPEAQDIGAASQRQVNARGSSVGVGPGLGAPDDAAFALGAGVRLAMDDQRAAVANPGQVLFIFCRLRGNPGRGGGVRDIAWLR
jgi:hypothetical protein